MIMGSGDMSLRKELNEIFPGAAIPRPQPPTPVIPFSSSPMSVDHSNGAVAARGQEP